MISSFRSLLPERGNIYIYGLDVTCNYPQLKGRGSIGANVLLWLQLCVADL